MAQQRGEASAVEELYGDLQHETLNLMAGVAVVASWLTVVLFFSPANRRALTTWLPGVGVVLLASILAIQLRERHFRLAAAALVASLLVAEGTVLRAFHNGQSLYFAALIISLANVLVGPGLAAAVTVGVLALAALGAAGGIPVPGLLGPATLAVLTLIVAWLSSRYLYMTVRWAWESHARSLEKAEEARRHRAQLASTSKSLEEAYGRLNRANEALAEAWQIAEEAKRFKSQFAANISHELRTPLYIIVGFAETMLFAPESYGTELPAAYRSDLVEVYNSSRHLVGLIDDVLDLSQIEAGRMGLVKEPTDVAAVIREAGSLVQPLIQRKGLSFDIRIEEPLPVLKLDRTRIRQTLLNLLSNAARYTELGGITLEARIAGSELLVSVADTGPGIPPDQLERIFQSFYQVEASTSRRHGGIGLGLAISRYFVEMHGGRIWAESEPGAGSRLCIALPLPDELPQAACARPSLYRGAPPRGESDGRQVLVINADPTSAVLLERHLDEAQVVQAGDAAEAEEQLKVARPQAIIAGEDSMAAALRLAGDGGAQATVSGIPLITCPLPSGPLPALALGVRGYLVKPVTRKRLLSTLERCAPAARRILVVDDDPRVVRLLSRMLLSAPRRYEITRAFDGQEALALMRSEPPDLVLLDLYMPRTDGFTVLEHMAEDSALAQTPVVVVSAKGLPEDGVVRLHGPITIRRPGGFTLAELFRCLQGLLDATRPPHAGDSASDPASVEEPPA